MGTFFWKAVCDDPANGSACNSRYLGYTYDSENGGDELLCSSLGSALPHARRIDGLCIVNVWFIGPDSGYARVNLIASFRGGAGHYSSDSLRQLS